MGLFGLGKSAAEKQLIETYAAGLQAKFGAHARKVAKQWVQMARQQAEAEGTLDVENACEVYLRIAESEPEARKRLAAKREDGVTDGDLRWWWGLHDLDRRMMLIDDDNSRTAFFMAKREAGLSGEGAVAEMRKAMPIYGDPTDTEHTTDDDRPLPDELRDRINRWLEQRAVSGEPDAFRKLVAGSSSFNALIRSEIRGGRL